MMTGADELLSLQSNGGGQAGLGVPTGGMSAADDLLCIDEALGLLDPLALDELQILADSHILTDPVAEDSLRYEWTESNVPVACS